jgi:hypothetical protein
MRNRRFGPMYPAILSLVGILALACRGQKPTQTEQYSYTAAESTRAVRIALDTLRSSRPDHPKLPAGITYYEPHLIIEGVRRDSTGFMSQWGLRRGT